MAASSTTRRGNGSGKGPAGGAGYGGPARAPEPFSAENQPPPEAKSAGHDVARAIRERIAAAKDAILDAQITRATDPTHPQGHQAAADLLNRVAPITHKTEVAVTTDPDRMTDEQLAAIAAGSSAPSAGTAQ